MKQNFLSLLALAASVTLLSCCISCTEKNNPNPGKDPEETVDDGKPKASDYTFTASPMKGTWQVGDQIQVHGSYAPAARVFTLQASNISTDGKTATLKLDGDIMEYFAAPDNLYAAWPASAVRAEDGLLDATTTFAVANIHLAQAYLEGTNFAFDDATGAITFTVSGGFDSVIIAGAQRPGLRFSSYSNAHSTSETSFVKVSSDGYPYREEPLTGASTTLWFPGRTTLKGGFTLYFGKGGNWTASYTYTSDLDLKAGQKLELGDISSKLVAYSGPKPSMPEISNVSKYALKFNELSGLCVDPSGNSIWAVGDGSEMAQISVGGELLHTATLRTTSGSSLDSEGLSINYDTGDFLISCEAFALARIPSAQIGNIFQSSKFQGVESILDFGNNKDYKFGNSGAEGCAYYKDGLVYMGTQTGSYLFCVKLATGEVLWRKGLREKHSVITEVAGLCYDPLTDWLWVIDSESHRFFALTGDGEQLLGAYSLKTKSNEESICVDHKNNCVWVGDDYGSTSYVYKYEMTGLDDAIIREQ